ncbi:tyrosine-type recombinase/integrase [Anaerococcus sp. Marseille-P3915]|uniref:tyrosine-type recombinase/integrase n=1 Tax=Anaerococcus sp. Marseille-P3915 TaxID=2057799 RepID=UPI000D0B6BAF|nr:tyrosine-type recombinase/integrase [Anaerococcus sp. Marseille-P3915]
MKIKKYQKGGKTYYKFNVYLGKDPLTGKEIRTNRQGFKSKKQAENAYLKLRTQTPTKPEAKLKTFNDAYVIWLETWQTTVKEQSVYKIKSLFKNQITPYIGDILLKEFTQLQAQAFIIDASKRYKNVTNIKIYAKAVLNYAKDLKAIETNPFDKIKVPKEKPDMQKINKKNYYTPEELKNFLEITKETETPQAYAFFRLLSHTGMRFGEALALERSDLNPKTNTLTISKSISRDKNGKQIISTTKTGNIRIISLDKETAETLIKLKETNKKHIFERSGKIVTRSYPLKVLNKIVEKNNLPKITLHGFRHTHATILLSMGKSIKYIQERLGHAEPSITLKIYSHIMEEEEKETPEDFASFLEG